MQYRSSKYGAVKTTQDPVLATSGQSCSLILWLDCSQQNILPDEK